jgi:hypothetical protein
MIRCQGSSLTICGASPAAAAPPMPPKPPCPSIRCSLSILAAQPLLNDQYEICVQKQQRCALKQSVACRWADVCFSARSGAAFVGIRFACKRSVRMLALPLHTCHISRRVPQQPQQGPPGTSDPRKRSCLLFSLCRCSLESPDISLCPSSRWTPGSDPWDAPAGICPGFGLGACLVSS